MNPRGEFGRWWADATGPYRGRHRPARLRRSAVVLVLCLLVIPLATSASGFALAPAQDVTNTVSSQNVDADDVLMEVHLREDGSAEWSVEYRVRLSDDNETEAFEELAAEIENDPEEFESRFADRMDETVQSASEATEREMRIEDVTVSTTKRHLPQEYGVVTYRFEWLGFAVVDGDEIVAGDAIEGLFLDEQTSMLVSWPTEYATVSVDPEPHEVRSSSVVWRGPVDFGSGEPAIVVSSASSTEPPTGTPSDDSIGSAISPLSIIGAVVVLLVLVGGALVWRSRTSGSLPGIAGNDGPTNGDGDRGVGDTDLLSNEERVLALLESRGGRMKQQEVVAELDWTEAKTSQVISGMREEGTIDGFRLGRENVISLPSEDDI